MASITPITRNIEYRCFDYLTVSPHCPLRPWIQRESLPTGTVDTICIVFEKKKNKTFIPLDPAESAELQRSMQETNHRYESAKKRFEETTTDLILTEQSFGLTSSERTQIAKNRDDAIKAYELAQDAALTPEDVYSYNLAKIQEILRRTNRLEPEMEAPINSKRFCIIL